MEGSQAGHLRDVTLTLRMGAEGMRTRSTSPGNSTPAGAAPPPPRQAGAATRP